MDDNLAQLVGKHVRIADEIDKKMIGRTGVVTAVNTFLRSPPIARLQLDEGGEYVTDLSALEDIATGDVL